MTDPDPGFWTSATPDEIAKRLAACAAPVLPEIARAVWQRAGSFRLSDPPVFLSLSQALLESVLRRTGKIAAGERVEPQSSTQSESTAIAWCCHAEALNANGHVREAIIAYERAMESVESGGPPELLGQMLVGRIHLLALAGRHRETRELIRRTERLLKRERLHVLLGKFYMNVGNAYYQQDRYQEAGRSYRLAEAVFRRYAPEDAARVGLLTNQGSVAIYREDFDGAADSFDQALRLATRLELSYFRAFVSFNKAVLEFIRGDHRQALQLLTVAGDIFQNLKTEDMAAAVTRLRSEIYLSLGMVVDALPLALSSAAVFAEQGMELDSMLSRMEAGRCLSLLGENVASRMHLETAEAYFRSQRNRPRTAVCRLYQADATSGGTASVQSASTALRALAAFEAQGLSRWAARARVVAARNFMETGRHRRASNTLAPALRRAGSLPLSERREVMALAGRISLRIGDRASARRRLERAASIHEQARRLIPGHDLRLMDVERQAGVYRDLLRMELARPRFNKLLEYTERTRTRRSDFLRGASPMERPAFRRKRTLLRSLTRRMDETDLFDVTGSPQKEGRSLQKRIVRLEKDLLAAWRRSEEGSGRVVRERSARSAENMVRALRRGESLVTYTFLDDQILALVLNEGRRQHLLLPATQAEVREALRGLQFQMSSALLLLGHGTANIEFLKNAADRPLGRLFRLLMEPLLPFIGESTRLRIVPYGFLHEVPFECLFDGGSYALDRWAITRLPGTEFLDRPTRRRRGPHLLAATVQSGPPLVAREVDMIAKMLSPGDGLTLVDSPTADLLRHLPVAGLIHISAHGTYRGDNPAFSRISTGDGALFLADIMEIRLKAELVVLSACDTGRTFSGEGDAMGGVPFSFLAAGARCLVASLWRIHDEATLHLMEAFYRHYLGGRTRDVAASLALASAETRRRWDHPLLWGGFCAYGN